MGRGATARPWPWHVLLLVATLIATGVVFIHSGTRDTELADRPLRQLISVAMALPLMLGLALVPQRVLARHASLVYVVSLVALVAVLFVGVEIKGSRRWFAGPAGFLLQPSELVKPALIVVLARYLEFRPPPQRFRDMLGPLLLTMVPFVLIRAEPDLGTAMILLPVAVGMLYAAGARRRHFLLGVALTVPLAYLALPFLEDYQLERIRTFSDSVPRLSAEAQEARREGQEEKAKALEAHIARLKRHSHYQSHYAQISIGSGGLTGKGVGEGPQNRLRFLPERHNDFVFAVVAEETGLVGSVGVVVLYLLLGWSVLSVGTCTRDRFGQLLCSGVALGLTSQALANMAMTMGLLPITGLPLPFLSQGGSSMMSSLAMIGLVLGVARAGRSTEPFLYPAQRSRDPFGAHRPSDRRHRMQTR